MIRWNGKNRVLIIQLPSGRNHRLWALVGFLVLINVLVSYVDLPLAEAMKQLDPGVAEFFGHLTKLGDSKYYLIPLALVLPFLLAARQALTANSVRRVLGWSAGAVLFLFTAVASSGLLVNLLKIIVGRARPKLWFSDGFYGFAPFAVKKIDEFRVSDFHSFPSGHSNTIVTLALALSFFLPRWRLPLFGVALVVALSRVIITAHFLSDILVGALVGLATTYWLRELFTRRGWVFVKRRGEYRLQAPGYLLGQKIRAFLWEKLGLPDGARGRLP